MRDPVKKTFGNLAWSCLPAGLGQLNAAIHAIFTAPHAPCPLARTCVEHITQAGYTTHTHSHSVNSSSAVPATLSTSTPMLHTRQQGVNRRSRHTFEYMQATARKALVTSTGGGEGVMEMIVRGSDVNASTPASTRQGLSDNNKTS